MMDTLISGFAEEHRRRGANGDVANIDRLTDHSLGSTTGSFTNKLSKFTLATFDDEGSIAECAIVSLRIQETFTRD